MFSFPTEKFLESEQRRQFFLKMLERIFLRDWGTKLAALAITLAIWFGVTGQSTTRRIQPIHLNLIPPSTMQISNEPIHEIEITVTGDKRKIDRLKPEDLIAAIDLSGTNSGERVVQLEAENVNLELPSGVKISEIQPNKILVKLEKIIEREVEVSPDLEGNLLSGFEIYDKISVPNLVRVRGPESIVKSLESVSTEKINVDGKNKGFVEQQIAVNSPNPKVTVIDTLVDINFYIGEKRNERTFSVAYKTENSSKNYNVILLAPREILDKIKPEDLQIEIGENNLPKIVLPTELQDKIEVKSVK